MQSQPKGKLRNKIFLMMALVSVMPILIAGFLSVYGITVSHRTDVASLEDALVDQKLGEIKNILGNIVKSLQANVITNRAPAIGETSRLLLKEVFTSGQALGLEEITLVGLDGKEQARLTVSQPEDVAASGLRDDSGAAWFSRVKAGTNYVSDEVDFSGDVPVITAADSARSQNGSINYFLIGKFSLGVAQAAIQNVALGKTGYLYLVDKNGKVIGSSINGPVPGADMKNTGIVTEVIQGNDFTGVEGQHRYKNFLGETVVASGQYLPDFHWGLLAEWPVQGADGADASVSGLIYNNLTVSIFVLVAVIAASILLATLIVRPVHALEKSTKLVAEGKFDERVNIKTGDELEELGTAFNKMIVGLKQLEELKNEFVFIAAHELRTPVGAMKGYLTLILEGLTGPITDKTKDFIQKVVDSNQRLIQLVNDLLEVSRSENGKLAIKVVPIDVAAPIRGVLVELQALADKAQVQMAYEPQSNLPKAMADADRLKEVMVNLIGNSIKYMGGSGKVTVSHEAQNENLITHIADTGLGISKEAQANLFEKFYRVASDKTKDIHGTGLGLFIVKEIIERMNGTIWVDSEEGKGSTFSFSLPIGR